MAITTANQDLQDLKREILNPETSIHTAKKRIRTILELYNSRRNRALVNKVVLGWVQNANQEVVDVARSFQLELRDAKIKEFRLRRKKLQSSEIPSLPPVASSISIPLGAIGKAKDTRTGLKHWIDKDGKSLGVAND